MLQQFSNSCLVTFQKCENSTVNKAYYIRIQELVEKMSFKEVLKTDLDEIISCNVEFLETLFTDAMFSLCDKHELDMSEIYDKVKNEFLLIAGVDVETISNDKLSHLVVYAISLAFRQSNMKLVSTSNQ